MWSNQVFSLRNSIKRLRQILYKIYLRVVYRRQYWKKEWDWEARQLSNKFCQENCRRSPTTNPEILERVKGVLVPQSDDVFLDVGCAAGPVVKKFKEVNMAYGMDLSFDMLKLAQLNLISDSRKHNFIQGNVTNIPFRSSIFSKILCYGVFQCISLDQAAKALFELVRIAESKGKILIGNIAKEGAKRQYFGFETTFYKKNFFFDHLSKIKNGNHEISVSYEDDSSFDLLIVVSKNKGEKFIKV